MFIRRCEGPRTAPIRASHQAMQFGNLFYGEQDPMTREATVSTVITIATSLLATCAHALAPNATASTAVKETGNRWQPTQFAGWERGLDPLGSADRTDPDMGVHTSFFSFQAANTLNINPDELARIELTNALKYTSGKFAIERSELIQYDTLSRLPPIESFFFGIPETVCLPDDRSQVSDTTQAPWSANCELIITMPKGTAVGTGWLAGPKLVITAGHCVHEGAGGQFFPSVEVIPGMNGPQRPFGSKISSKLRASTEWQTNGTWVQDYGAIILDTPFLTSNGRSPAIHTVAVLTDEELARSELYLSGYPADKPFGSQWTDSDPVSAVRVDQLTYMLDTYGGHSGSAVLLNSAPVVVGIHNYGGCPNKCTRITSKVKQDIDRWIAESSAP